MLLVSYRYLVRSTFIGHLERPPQSAPPRCDGRPERGIRGVRLDSCPEVARKGTIGGMRPSRHIEPVTPVDIARHYIRELIYGANDGVITTFAIVAGVAGGGLSLRVVLIMGAANLLADGLSMAVGNYLSIRSHESVLESQDLPEEEAAPIRHAGATFLAFVGAGIVPLVPYMLPAFPGGSIRCLVRTDADRHVSDWCVAFVDRARAMVDGGTRDAGPRRHRRRGRVRKRQAGGGDRELSPVDDEKLRAQERVWRPAEARVDSLVTGISL